MLQAPRKSVSAPSITTPLPPDDGRDPPRQTPAATAVRTTAHAGRPNPRVRAGHAPGPAAPTRPYLHGTATSTRRRRPGPARPPAHCRSHCLSGGPATRTRNPSLTRAPLPRLYFFFFLRVLPRLYFTHKYPRRLPPLSICSLLFLYPNSCSASRTQHTTACVFLSLSRARGGHGGRAGGAAGPARHTAVPQQGAPPGRHRADPMHQPQQVSGGWAGSDSGVRRLVSADLLELALGGSGSNFPAL